MEKNPTFDTNRNLINSNWINMNQNENRQYHYRSNKECGQNKDNDR